MTAATALAVLLTAKTGTVTLPSGRLEVHRELRLPSGVRDLTIVGKGTTLVAANDFAGRSLLSCERCAGLTIRNLALDGNRARLEKPVPVAPTDLPFARFYQNNGILIEDSSSVLLEHVDLTNIANFPIIVTRSRKVDLIHLSVSSSGSRNAKGRNNTSGGVLLEQGTDDFLVADSVFRGIRGNGVWTHSCYRSPRNLRGRIAHNRFEDIGRDAIQIGHASGVTVSGNTGARVGFVFSEVDVEGGGTPVAIDTAGNVDNTIYEYNQFEEVDGKCIDLDGFHDGSVRGNTCINRGKPTDYPYGNFGISLNNTSIEMQSRNILIENNTLDGMKFGAIFVVGAGHKIVGNTLRHLNLAHCNETHAQFGCIAILKEPGFLESGIFLAARAERPDPARNITIENNTISGWKMARYCVRAASTVSLTSDKIQGNHCSDE